MLNLPFAKPGQFWKANLHAHTTRSDGKLTPAELCGIYREAGYNVLAVTDHFMERFGYPIVDSTPFRAEGFTTLLGAELHGPGLPTTLWHLLAVGLPADFAHPTADETGPQVGKRASEAGAFVAIAHPGWYTLPFENAMEIDYADAVEVWNTTCHYDNDRGESWYMADQLLAEGRNYFAIATDDAHCSLRPDTFGGWTMIRSETLEPDALLVALKAGSFYCSTGPAIHDIRVEGDEMVVECDPAIRIFATGGGPLHRDVTTVGATEARFEI
ncbi:MAG TPA: CehA/McbA family metallohydrolase, partial [Thermomicrobiales bacterium]|nr:CehA/McbA family metallohydrolase [Thermomicrobiales bacterium]